MKKDEFAGIFPYLVTPIDEDGNINEDVLRELVVHLISKGVHGLTPLGSTGEGPYLNWENKEKVIRIVVDGAQNNVPVIAGVNSMTTKSAIAEAKMTESLKVDGIIVVLPDYFPINEENVIMHFASVSKAVQCPVTLYTNPKFSSWDFTLNSLKILSEIPNIKYLKDASGNIGKLMSISTVLNDKIKIFSASAHVPTFVFMLGGVGWMAGPACLIPEKCVELYDMACEKKWNEALALQKELWPLNIAFQKYNLAACVKAGLEIQGFKVGRPLAPQASLNDDGKREVEKILRQLGAL